MSGVWEDPKAATSGASSKLISKAALEFAARYKAARFNNPRVNPTVTAALMAFGATPAASSIGYVNSGISTTGYNFFNIGNSGTDIWPAAMYGALPYNAGGSIQTRAFDSTGGTRLSGVGRAVFITDEPKPIFSVIGFGSTYRFRVDGQALSIPLVAGSSGGYQPLQLDFSQIGGRKRRAIEILLKQDDTIQGIYVSSTSSLSTPQASPRILCLTDSLGLTVTNGVASDAFAAQIADYLGVPDCYMFGEGASGYTTVGSNGRTVPQRVALAGTMFPNAVDAVLLAAGVNDADDANFQPGVLATAQQCRTIWPNAPVVVLGVWAGNSLANQAAKATQEAKIAAAVTAAADPMVQFVPTMSDRQKWIFGSGNTSAAANNGNADLIFDSSDGTHWNLAGHSYIAPRVADGFYDAVIRALLA